MYKLSLCLLKKKKRNIISLLMLCANVFCNPDAGVINRISLSNQFFARCYRVNSNYFDEYVQCGVDINSVFNSHIQYKSYFNIFTKAI